MSPENEAKYRAMVEKINAMILDQIEALVLADQCPFEPEHMIGVPIGMFHCEVCGEMVVAGFPHPRKTEDQA